VEEEPIVKCLLIEKIREIPRKQEIIKTAKRPFFGLFPEGKTPEFGRFWPNSGVCLFRDFLDQMLC
jgi:hypothetical protein